MNDANLCHTNRAWKLAFDKACIFKKWTQDYPPHHLNQKYTMVLFKLVLRENSFYVMWQGKELHYLRFVLLDRLFSGRDCIHIEGTTPVGATARTCPCENKENCKVQSWLTKMTYEVVVPMMRDRVLFFESEILRQKLAQKKHFAKIKKGKKNLKKRCGI